MDRRILAALLPAMLAGSASAASVINFPGTPLAVEGYFTTATSSANVFKTFLTTTGVTDCNSMIVSNFDSVPHNVTVQVYPNAAVAPSYGVVITVAALTSAPLLGDAVMTGFAQDQNQNRYIRLATGDTLQVAYSTALGAGATIGFIANCVTGYN